MSTEALEKAMGDLQSLPETDQKLVLGFLASLKDRRERQQKGPITNVTNPSLQEKGGLLVFVGSVDAPENDWVQRDRDERERELLAASTGNALQ